MVFKDYGRRPSVKWTEGYVFFGFYTLCRLGIIFWYCHMVIIVLMMTENGFLSQRGAITFERATDGLWLTYMSR